MARWTAAAVVAYYAKRYHIEKGILWGFMSNLFGIGIGEKTRIDALDQYEFLRWSTTIWKTAGRYQHEQDHVHKGTGTGRLQ